MADDRDKDSYVELERHRENAKTIRTLIIAAMVLGGIWMISDAVVKVTKKENGISDVLVATLGPGGIVTIVVGSLVAYFLNERRKTRSQLADEQGIAPPEDEK
ncbi:hypothetical protein [Singulisphaera sp. PoT]|uniref:hypothetical protein n=1 Tax=Singulisphaera sp. PoT TaxID=3411797 RepID=UPI003BF5E42D